MPSISLFSCVHLKMKCLVLILCSGSAHAQRCTHVTRCRRLLALPTCSIALHVPLLLAPAPSREIWVCKPDKQASSPHALTSESPEKALHHSMNCPKQNTSLPIYVTSVLALKCCAKSKGCPHTNGPTDCHICCIASCILQPTAT